MNRVLATVCAVLAWPVLAGAQINGTVTVMGDMLPNAYPDGRQAVSELRTRAQVEGRHEVGSRLRLVAGGYVDTLVSDRQEPSGKRISSFGHVRPLDVYAEARTAFVEVRAGMSRIVWGRLDEFQPTDVVNPIDLSRFLTDGRAEARLSVPMIRARVFLPASATLEALVTPKFRAGVFDELREATSPFNLAPKGLPLVRVTPDVEWNPRRIPGGARLSATTGRVDWSVSTFRGNRAFPTYASNGIVPVITETFPQFTMFGGDFETARGAWGIRGEVAAFTKDQLQSTRFARGVAGRSWQGGVGVDRKAGAYRVAGDVLWASASVDSDDLAAARIASLDRDVEHHSLSLVGSADRSFAKDTRRIRGFAVYDATHRTSFSRFIGAVGLADNVWFETSAGLFLGRSAEPLGRLTNEDFVYARLKVFF